MATVKNSSYYVSNMHGCTHHIDIKCVCEVSSWPSITLFFSTKKKT